MGVVWLTAIVTAADGVAAALLWRTGRRRGWFVVGALTWPVAATLGAAAIATPPLAMLGLVALALALARLIAYTE